MPSFSLQGWHPLSRTPLSSFLQTTLLLAGVHGNVSDHSFRIGAATTAASPGIPDHLIKTKGHWSSKVYIIYCMYVLWWTQSFQLLENLLSRYVYGAYLLLCLALLSVIRFGHSYWGSVFHQPLARLLSGPWPPRLGMGAHGWVARICQPLEQSSLRSWLPIKEAPGYLRHPTSTPRGGC